MTFASSVKTTTMKLHHFSCWLYFGFPLSTLELGERGGSESSARMGEKFRKFSFALHFRNKNGNTAGDDGSPFILSFASRTIDSLMRS